MNKSHSPISEIKSLKEIASTGDVFNIPMYQRLYVWENMQISTLIEDLYKAYLDDKELFLGALIVVKNEDSYNDINRTFDLIDGQQRFTTLWLLSTVLGGKMQEFTFTKSDKELRLRFAIRKRVSDYFEHIAKHSYSELSIPEEDNELYAITHSLKMISEREEVKNLTASGKDEFATFIMNHVHFVFTVVDQQTDLNKLFQVINSRGVQLQHHEILKARLLDCIAQQEQLAYGSMWDYCSQMDSYLVQNIPSLIRSKIIETNRLAQCFGDPETLVDVLNKVEYTKNNRLTIDEIIKAYKPGLKTDKLRDNDVKAESILKFPLFLLHVLRLYLAEYNYPDIASLNDKYLLETFNEHFFAHLSVESRSSSAIVFIKMLWKIRHQFDKHVIKWIDDDDSLDVKNDGNKRSLKIKRITYSSGFLNWQNASEKDSIGMLQSMLFHSKGKTTMYWLTPFLNETLKTEDDNSLYNFLRKLDNALHHIENDNLKTSYRYILEPPPASVAHNIKSILTNGTYQNGLSQYLFYKLEFILWFNWKHDVVFRQQYSCNSWDKYRITSKNSIEHISPQKPREYEKNDVTIYKHHFGNLALLTTTMNSENNNKVYSVKRQEFIEKKPGSITSLKLDLVFENKEWNDDRCINHQNEMIKLFTDYMDRSDFLIGKDEDINEDRNVYIENTKSFPMVDVVVITATYGKDNKRIDVTDMLNSLPCGGNGQKISNSLFGNDPFEGKVKNLEMIYKVDGNLRTFNGREGTPIELNIQN